ncbi:MAG: hypothetical protein U5K75_10310 [Ahrensia sp.]|nr:hypothetical protein [Ahrensia sp.]
MNRTNKALELARMMIKQAKLLKSAGMAIEARAMARRAWDMNVMAHGTESLVPIPVRVTARRR